VKSRRAVAPMPSASEWFPMAIKYFASAAALALAAGLGSVSPAQAQYAKSPFIDWSVEQSQAYGLEVIALRLKLAQHFAPPYDEELAEGFEKIGEINFARFRGTLEERDPELATALHTAIEEMLEVVEAGENAAKAAAAIEPLLARARDVVLSPEIRNDPAHKAAVMSKLLLADGGVAESYEEAIEEVWEYPSGFFAMARVEEMWADIGGLATPQRHADVTEMLVFLRGLYPDAGPPASTAGWNPEEGEAPAHRIVGILEEVVGADLYPNRDFAAVARHMVTTTETACGLFAQDKEALGTEHLYAVHDDYRGMRRLVNMFGPELHKEATELLEALAPRNVEDDDDDDKELSSADACVKLQETLTEVVGLFGG